VASGQKPAASAVTKLDRRPRLVDLAIEPLALLHAAFGPNAPLDTARLREQWSAQRARFESEAKTHGHREHDVKMSVYAIAVALDEAVMSHPDKIGGWLQTGALQLEFHEQRELVGGQRFFVRLEELRKQRDAAIEAIEVYDACLALGYRGRYVADPAGRDGLIAALYVDITAVRGEPSGPIAPNVARTDEETGETLKKLPPWVAPAVLAGAVVLSWLTVVLISWLHAHGVAGALSRL
jgi:type VI secretion system protein ImpK